MLPWVRGGAARVTEVALEAENVRTFEPHAITVPPSVTRRTVAELGALQTAAVCTDRASYGRVDPLCAIVPLRTYVPSGAVSRGRGGGALDTVVAGGTRPVWRDVIHPCAVLPSRAFYRCGAACRAVEASRAGVEARRALGAIFPGCAD